MNSPAIPDRSDLVRVESPCARGDFTLHRVAGEREGKARRRQLFRIQPEIGQVAIDELDNEEIGSEVLIRSENKQHHTPGGWPSLHSDPRPRAFWSAAFHRHSMPVEGFL